MSSKLYENGYRPTMNLRQFAIGFAQNKAYILQQEWVSDYQGWPPVWRRVPIYYPAKGEGPPE